MRVALAVWFALLGVALSQTDPSWDHQTETYNANHSPVTIASGNIDFTAYFSPDHSADTHVNLINSAQTSIDIGEPGFDSWIGCTDGSSCIGCNVTGMRNDETFPLWGALLNAVHRGVTVRVLTPNYGTPDCQGSISPLPFFQLNGIQVRWFATTTYIHAKYMMVDGKIISVSSVNWSHASYMDNREAGALIQGDDAQPFIDFCNGVYEADWAEGIPLQVDQTYSSSDMAIITDTTEIPVTIPPIPVLNPDRYVTPAPYSVGGDYAATIYASPDSADATLLSDINSAQVNLTVMMYQITSPDLCNAVQTLNGNNIPVNLLVSYRIYDAADCAAAKVCYKQLYNAGLTIYMTPSYYFFSHQKFWIVDGQRVGWSTGNWSPTDYPTGDMTFPPYGQSGWRNTNRDFTVSSNNPNLVSQFTAVYTNDLQDADTYSPDYTIKCGS